MSNQVVRVKRERVTACMSCPLCNKLLRDATTISECLHTFCRKCIYNKISSEELECCPICTTYLGCDPLEKLRPDHNLQDVRSKIFPSKRKKLEAAEVAPLVSTLPVKRKERSLSSLVVNTPRIKSLATTTRRRSKSVARRVAALRSSIFSIEKPLKKDDTLLEEFPGSSSSPETLHEFNQNVRQNSPSAEPLSTPPSQKEPIEAWNGKNDPWKPLTCLVEVASRTKSHKFHVEDAADDLELTDVPECRPRKRKPKFKADDLELTDVPEGIPRKRKPKIKEQRRKSNILAKKKLASSTILESAITKKLRKIQRKRSQAFGESGIPSKALSAAKHYRTGPIWFSLVAAEDQEGEAPLPQISANYLRIKDGKMPVNFIQKYLMKKLNLSSEDEVEIKCMDQPVLPTLELCDLVDSWLKKASSSHKILASVGTSAKDFVMVLAYGRKCRKI